MTNAQQTFINEIGVLVQKYCKEYGYGVPSAIIAQAINESNWGKSSLSANYHNYFGMKCGSSWKGGSVNMKTKEEYIPGTLTTIRDNFRTYSNMDEGVKGYFEFLEYSRYATARQQTDPIQFISELGKAGYYTSTTYVETIRKTISVYSLTDWDKEPVVEVPKEDVPVELPKQEMGYFLEDGVMTIRAKTWLELKAIVEHLENIENDKELRELVSWLV